MSSYPEHDKVRAVKEQSQSIGEFIEWLGEHNMAVCEFTGDNTDHWWPTGKPTTKLLAQFFEIDLDKLEEEKRAMLEECRQHNRGRGANDAGA